MTREQIEKEIRTAYRLDLPETARAWEKELEQLERFENPQFHANPKTLPQLLESLAAIGHQAITGAVNGAQKAWAKFPEEVKKALR